MKNSKTFGFEIVISALLTGCVIGNGTICGPGTPVAYCDREVYEKLTHPKPYLDYWEKSTMAIKQRQEDWLNCGGKDDGTFAPTKKAWRLNDVRKRGTIFQHMTDCPII